MSEPDSANLDDYRNTGTSPTALEAAVDYFCRSGGAVAPELAGCDRTRERERQQRMLIQWAECFGLLSTPEKDPGGFGRLLQTPTELAGNEHRVFLDEEARRVVKMTFPDEYGKAYPRINGLPVWQEAVPAEYFTRLLLSNEVFGDDVRIERVVLAANGSVSVVTSQRLIVGFHPVDPKVHDYLRAEEFEPVEAVDGKPMTNDWYRHRDRVMVFDAHGGNFIETRDGDVAPIDIYVERLD